MSSGLHLYRLLAQLYNTLDVEVLPPCTPTEAQRRDPQAFAAAVRAVMAGALRVPMVDVVSRLFACLPSSSIASPCLPLRSLPIPVPAVIFLLACDRKAEGGCSRQSAIPGGGAAQS